MSEPDWPQMGDPLNDRLPPARRSGNVADAHDQVIQAQLDAALDEIDKLRAVQLAEYPHELYCPSIDVCAICSDSECDGISCMFGLCPDIEDDRELLEQVQTWVRLGRIQEQANAFLAVVENRA